LLCKSNLIVLFASLHSIPYHSQWLVYSSTQKSLVVHSPPFAESKNTLRAFRSFGHKILSLTRSKLDMEQRVKGAGGNLWNVWHNQGGEIVVASDYDHPDDTDNYLHIRIVLQVDWCSHKTSNIRRNPATKIIMRQIKNFKHICIVESRQVSLYFCVHVK
jgi:hypothetical protein